jgi:thiamine pyrophosphokinase
VPIHAGAGVDLLGAPGAVLTLLALGGAAEGITTDGLRWPLRRETLTPGSTRGVSNEIVAGPVRVALTAGALLAVGTSPLERADDLPQ